MSQIMIIATLKLNDGSLLKDWKVLSDKITADLTGHDGFISRDSVRGDDGLVYCILKWESKEIQVKTMTEIMARTDDESMAMMAEFGRVVDMESMTKEFFEVV